MFIAEAGTSSSDQITRDQFHNFVSSHERALKKAFQLFDKDGGCKKGIGCVGEARREEGAHRTWLAKLLCV
eukprot:416310-Pelagomonas_calceolata.AAC.1